MKVLLFDFGYCYTPHMETEAEIVQRHLDRGDHVLRLSCRGELPICTFNPTHSLPKCAECLSRRQAVKRLIRPRVLEKSVLCLTAEDRRAVAGFRFCGQRLAELKQLKFGDFDLGLAVASVMVDATRDPDPDLNFHRTDVHDWIGVTLAAYLSARNILVAEKPDRVYVMNGRWCYTRAVLRACQACGVECCCHERGGDRDRYLLATNRLPHEIAGTTESIEESWCQADPVDRESVGAAFFEGKAKGVERQWFSFVADQQRGRLPEDWSGARRNVAVFMTSEFEFAAIGSEYTYRFYKDQNDALGRIIAGLESRNSSIHLNIRVHPNMKGVRNANIDWVLALRSPKATVIAPQSAVSSYALLHACEKVLTFGSTMGIEAAYWGKPSILGGPGVYQNLGATYNPSTHDELMEMLLNDLPPKLRDGALKFGYHELRKGLRHVYYEAETPFRGRFKGRDYEADSPWVFRAIMRLARALRWRFTRLSQWHRQRARRRLGVTAQGTPALGNTGVSWPSALDAVQHNLPKMRGCKEIPEVATLSSRFIEAAANGRLRLPVQDH